MQSQRLSAPIPADPLLSVVMPVYNERTTVETIIRRVLAVPMRIQLIVVDDGSRDGSGDILERLQAELGFTLLRKPDGGKGSALRKGFAAVTGDIVVIQDPEGDGFIIKRVFKMGGESVPVEKFPAFHHLEDGAYVVPEGNVFVLGDNLTQSEDSRVFGPVPLNRVIGKVVVRP